MIRRPPRSTRKESSAASDVYKRQVCIIPILPNGNLCLIRQYRYDTRAEFIEIPAGKLDVGEDPLVCAKRELEEEIGYIAGKLTFLTNIHPAIGFSNEKMWVYLAEDLILSKQDLDQDEFLELYPIPVKKAIDLIYEGKITDVKTVIGILWLDKFLS